MHKQLSQVVSGWLLKDPEAKFWNHSQYVVENIRLDCIVVRPDDIVRKYVNLKGQTLRCWVQLTHQKGQVLSNLQLLNEKSESIAKQ